MATLFQNISGTFFFDQMAVCVGHSLSLQSSIIFGLLFVKENN